MTARTDQSIVIVDPRDGSEVGTVLSTSPQAVDEALAQARRAYPDWHRMAPAVRGELLEAAADALEADTAELARMNERETGRPFDEAAAGVAAGAATLRQYAQLGPLHRGEQLCGQFGAIDYSVHEPFGVAVVLTPWNDPVAVAAGLIGAALATGNVVIHKPSERCPHLGRLLGEALGPVFPIGVLTTLDGGPMTGEALVSGADVVAHVGSTATGQAIARQAAATGAKVIRENGGKDPLIVDADVDPAWAAEQAAVGAFANSGQICTSVERIYVHRQIAARFCSELAARARQRNAEHSVAPLVDRRLREIVARQVDEANAAGAELLAGGMLPEGPGAHYPATVLAGCTAEMEVMREETFGPVAPVMTVNSFDEALAQAASGRYGLAATVLTHNLAHAQRAAVELPAGTVKVNAVFGGAPGGSAHPRKDSGAGAGYGPGLLDEFTQLKVVHIEQGGENA
ncbi:aldehyde dehydrogenase family protein [Propionimicrobium sp. PCR01-08-3]|uniref:aldehyde dehydrogenase family protein n=1 Tax=Propionimicrobium sp. PCR01-08-3 TaxID=3052086 RepID=UPI00255C2889|nr:aldehyde dehydrogenase family protein [Propionimicrobium sp. PCR01-08-3]WIY82165.1 aldehyde dehydrogenase family protein [Propionimicrobium sp. PCR01-08-3]